MANKKRKFVIGRKKKQFDHRKNFDAKKSDWKKLNGNKLIPLLNDKDLELAVDLSSAANEKKHLDENLAVEDEDHISPMFDVENDNAEDMIIEDISHSQDIDCENLIVEDKDYVSQIFDFENNDARENFHIQDEDELCEMFDVEYDQSRNSQIGENCKYQDEYCESDMDDSEYGCDSDSETEVETDFPQNPVDDSGSRPQGNRIVDISFIFDQIKEMNSHSVDCNFNDMNLLIGHEESKRGFNVSYKFICSKCSYIFSLKNTMQTATQLDMNYAAVFAAFAVGMGYSQLQEFTGILGIPSMAQSTFLAQQKKLLEDLEAASNESMALAAEAEKENAIRNGSIDQQGKPVIKCHVDTAWAKRSYGTNYASASGTASLIGHHTKKVIWNGVADKYCQICTRIVNKNLEPYEHECNINYVGTSTGMEAKLVLDGFKECEELYGLRIDEIIADGDSNVLSELNKSGIYKHPMLKTRKLECCNHLFKNAKGKLIKLSKSKLLKKILKKSKIEEIIKGIRCAKDHWIQSDLPESTQIENLRHDILNAPAHVFGDHKNCADYFCKKKDKNEPNLVKIMKENNTYNSILKALSTVRVNARSVLKYETTNVVERLHSLIVKYTGGKRNNYTKSKSYRGRARCAVLQLNTRRLYSSLCEYKNKTPQPTMNNLEFKRITKNLIENAKDRKFVPKRLQESGPDCSYGACDKNDLEFDIEKNLFLEEIKENVLNWTTADTEKYNQFNSVKAMLLTSSNFGTVCNARSPESFENIVNEILYEETDTANQIDHETTYKSHALHKLEQLEQITVEECGLFIDPNIHTFGATPDGLVGTDCIVMVKCPLSTFEVNIEDSILAGKLPFWKKENKRKNNPQFMPKITGMNMKHKWYYQVQGQLHITQREYCYLVVWASDELPLRVEKIKKDDRFWLTNMEEKLKAFYDKVLLPELVDSRASRNMPLRKFDKDYVCIG